MDIQSFLLGMGAVLLIVSAVGGVVALVKVGNLKREVNQERNNRNMEMQSVYRQFDDVQKSMDSRFDKMNNKFSNKFEDIKSD